MRLTGAVSAFLIAALTSPFLLASAQAPGPPASVTAVLDRYIAAAGGRAALEKLTSVTMVATLEVADIDLSGTVRVTRKPPNLYVTESELTFAGDVVIRREGFDGTVAWAYDADEGPQQKTGLPLAEAKLSGVFPRELLLASLYTNWTMKPREKVADRDADVVEASGPGGAPIRMYFDVESGLLVRQNLTITTEEGPIVQEQYYSDYRTVDRIKRSFLVKQVSAASTSTLRFTEIKFNIPIDDAVFKMPAKLTAR